MPIWGTTVAQWLRYCATNRKVAGSIPDGVTGISIDIIIPTSQLNGCQLHLHTGDCTNCQVCLQHCEE
jgi:hypothetical protein